MITDTLSDAVAEIRDYMTRQPSVYAGQKEQIEAVVAAMDALRRELDGVLPDPAGPYASVHEALEHDPTGPWAHAAKAR